MSTENYLTLSNECSEETLNDFHSSPTIKSILEVAPFALTLWKENMTSIMCNRHVLDIFNIENGEDFLKNFYTFSPKYQPNGKTSAELSKLHFEKALANGKHVFHWLHLTSDGHRLPVEVTLIRLSNNSDNAYVVGFIKDLSTDFSYEKIDNLYDFYFNDKLPKNVLMEEIEELSDEWFFSIDLNTNICQYYGNFWLTDFIDNPTTTEKEILTLGFIHKDDIEKYKEMMREAKNGSHASCDLRLIDESQNYSYHRISCKVMNDSNGLPVFIVGKGINIHEQKVFEERSQKDLLTDCYNKISAENIISNILSTNPDGTHVFFIVDIDNFKSINDNLGHFFGDEVLREISTGLKSAFRDIDIVARIGGDEFIIFLKNLSDLDIIKSKANKILDVYRRTYSGQYKDYSISGSVGIAHYPHDGTTYNELYQNADKALNQAKIQGKNRYTIYSSDLNVGTTRNITKIENANRIASTFFDYDLISAVFNILYEKNGSSDAINLALSYLCQKYGADRSYIFETLDAGLTYDNTFEFCKDGITSEINNLKGIPGEFFVDFISKAHNDIIYSNNLRETFEHDKAFEMMVNQGILSFVHAQIKQDGEMRFFIGLDDCTKTRVWTEREINSLQYIGKLLSIILQGNHLRDDINALAISNKNSADILDNSDSLVYVSDIYTYDLLYLNKVGRDAFGVLTHDDYRTRKCYDVLQGKSEPCEFCTNHLINEDDYYEWSINNEILNKTYLLKDKLITYNGKIARLEIATDVTTVATLEEELQNKLDDERFLMNCVEMLHSGNEPNSSIYSLLEAVTSYFDSERSYIFEISDCGKYISNTYEYCIIGNKSYLDNLQNLPIDNFSYLLNKCHLDDTFTLNINDAMADDNIFEFELMQIESLSEIIISSIKTNDSKVTGFVGVDNPKKNKNKTSIIRSIAKFTATFLDETEVLSKLNKLSYFDTLTGIKNRHSYRKALSEINEKHIDSLGVAYFDIEGLSSINDARGNIFGDNVLITLSKILYSIFKDNVFRVGGDEFIVLTDNISEHDFESKINQLKAILSKESHFKVSIGYTWNQNYVQINTDLCNLHEGDKYTRILTDNLEMEIASEKYIVYLQPQINLANGDIESAEALIRRIGAGGTMQPPIFFIPFYEKEGIISKIDTFVFETVCKTLKKWKELGNDKLSSVSVNCSRMTISEKGIVEKFSAICDAYGIERSKIVIEITETINGINENVLAEIIGNFSDAGFSVSLDDFGSGYSNLNSLVVSDFDEIKIDMKIIDGIHIDEKSKALTQVAITLCDKLSRLTSVAEGVECKEQHDLLREMGCKIGQGYYYSKPVGIDEFFDKYINK